MDNFIKYKNDLIIMPKNTFEKKPNENQVLSIRLPLGLKKQIIEDMQTIGDFATMTSWLQAAAREFLASRKDERERLGGGGGRLIDCLIPGHYALV